MCTYAFAWNSVMPNIGNQMTALLLAAVFGLHLKLCLDLYAIKEKRGWNFRNPRGTMQDTMCIFVYIIIFNAR